jgi:transposase
VADGFRFYVGIDWATEEHQVAIFDAGGTLLRELKVKHDGEAIEKFARLVEELTEDRPSTVACSIETPRGAIIEALLERGVAIFAINPKQLDRFRDRHTIAGAKDDRRDAFVLGDSLRTDQKLFRRVELGDAVLVQLREMSRTHDELVAETIALSNRLRENVHRYFPQWLELGSFLEDAWLRTLFASAPTPVQLRHLKRSKVEAVLLQHRIRRITVDEVLATLRKRPLPVAPGVVEAASEHAKMIVPRLQLALKQKKACDERIAELLDQLGRPDGSVISGSIEEPRKAHRDADILLSLPGAGVVISATMLAEAGSALATADYHALRVRCGVAPVSHQTGKQKKPSVSMRYACNPRLRNCLHYWAGVAIQRDQRCKRHYADLRAVGHSHPRALRGVADRLLAILASMLKSRTIYDPSRRTAEGAKPTQRPPSARRRGEKRLSALKLLHAEAALLASTPSSEPQDAPQRRHVSPARPRSRAPA